MTGASPASGARAATSTWAFASGSSGSDHIILGAEFYRPFDLLGPGSGLLMSWVLGVGAIVQRGHGTAVPLGSVSAPHSAPPAVCSSCRTCTPGWRFELAAYDLDGREQTDTSGRFDIDIGADAAIRPSFVLRVGATLGETTTFGAGAAYRLQRRLIVR
jgi:hypothetical protein